VVSPQRELDKLGLARWDDIARITRQLDNLALKLETIISTIASLVKPPPAVVPTVTLDSRLDALIQSLKYIVYWGRVTTASKDSLTVSEVSWPENIWSDCILIIVSGTGAGQVRNITSNTYNRIVVETEFDIIPDSSSTFVIWRTVTVSNIVKLGGTTLTGRDISLDLAKLDVALSTRASEDSLARMVPIAKASIFNTALPSAEANWLATDITPTNSPSYLRIYVCVSVAGVLRVARTVGGTTVTENLNAGNNLSADCGYMFDVPWRSGDSINFRYSVTTGTIKRLIADEIGAAL